jgi:hypothetical protein
MKKYILTLVLATLCTASLCHGEVLLSFKDKTTVCGNYTLQGNSYCKYLSAGSICWQKADVVAVKTVDECEDNGGFASGGVASSGGARSSGVAVAGNAMWEANLRKSGRTDADIQRAREGLEKAKKNHEEMLIRLRQAEK